MDFTPSKAKRDIWMCDCGDHYECITLHVDDLLIASKDPSSIIKALADEHKFKSPFTLAVIGSMMMMVTSATLITSAPKRSWTTVFVSLGNIPIMPTRLLSQAITRSLTPPSYSMTPAFKSTNPLLDLSNVPFKLEDLTSLLLS